MAFIKASLYCAVVLATLYLTAVYADASHDSRGVIGLIPSVVPCNFTEQSGSTCLSCNQSLYCFNNNIGILYSCGGLLPHCNAGHCSIVRPQNCTTS